MSMREALSFDKTLTRLDLLLGILALVAGMLLTAGATYARVRGDIDDVKARVKVLEEAKLRGDARTNRIERNIVRIGTKFGIEMEDPTE